MYGQVQGGLAAGVGAMEELGAGVGAGAGSTGTGLFSTESWCQRRGRCRLGQLQGVLAPVEGAMEEPGGRSRGRCRLGLVLYRVVQLLVREPLKSHEVGGGAGAGMDRYRVV